MCAKFQPDNDEHSNRFKNTTLKFFYNQMQPIRAGRHAISYLTSSGLFSVIFPAGKKSARQKCRWLLDYTVYHPARLPLCPAHFGVTTNYIYSESQEAALQCIENCKFHEFLMNNVVSRVTFPSVFF